MRLKLLRSCLVISCLLLPLLPARAFAAETADEAEIEFQLGADRYDAGDYKNALRHFLASNRLAPNKNVLFNIARCYEDLKQLPEAYRYLTQSLEAEQSEAGKQRIEESLARLKPKVALFTVVTDPPGATIYLDREDLGSHGVTPRTLALPEGEHTVLVKLPDFEPGKSEKVTLVVGREARVNLKLKPILGTVQVTGTAGASVHLDSPSGRSCSVPCNYHVRPGKHTLLVSRDGFRDQEVPVEVVANRSLPVRAVLEPLSGSLVVNADVRDALVSIDGQPRAFTPAVVSLTVGKHEVVVSQSGFRPVKRSVVVEADKSVKVDLDLSAQQEVLGASRAAEAVEDAPASVTIISRQELRAMAYPTIAEAIRGIRGIYLSYDDNYNSPGVRGFARPGDYGNRILVLLDGHPMNDNWIWSSYIGFDARADIDDVERIEVIRGAGSVVYGTGAFFGVINLITRDRSEPSHVEVSTSTALGAGRARVTGVYQPTPHAGFWLSVSGAKSAGIDRYYPEYVSEPTDMGPSIPDYRGNPATGVVSNADGFKVGTVGGHAWYRDFSARWLLTSHEKHSPSAPYGTPFGNPNTTNTDTRGFVELELQPVWQYVESLTRVYLDTYHYTANLPYAPNSVDPESFGTENDEYTGLWGGLEQRLVFKLPPAFKLTVGGAYTRHFKTHQYNIDDRARAGYTGPDAGPISDNDTPFENIAGYALADAVVSPALHLSAGARIDYFSKLDFDAGAALSPRVAVIVKPYSRGNLKIMAGKAFRVPSVYERFYVSATQIQPGSIRPEQIYSGETEFTHHFSSAVSGLVTAYANYVTDLIELGTVSQNGEELNQYKNSDAPVLVLGAEAEVRQEFRQGWMLAAAFGVNNARYLKDDNLRHVPNSPTVLGSVKAAMPIIGRTLALATRMSVEGPRYDNQVFKTEVSCDPNGIDAVACPKQGTTDTGVVWDIVFTGAVERFNASYSLGVYNAMDWQYDTVPSTEFLQRTIRQRPRSLLASVSLKF
ncbi:MAG TPA: TonB-dependent receptor [Polyangiaceae bacterium]|nr:TonB-dependent receptor [Polyangiaceae bacterium]